MTKIKFILLITLFGCVRATTYDQCMARMRSRMPTIQAQYYCSRFPKMTTSTTTTKPIAPVSTTAVTNSPIVLITASPNNFLATCIRRIAYSRPLDYAQRICRMLESRISEERTTLSSTLTIPTTIAPPTTTNSTKVTTAMLTTPLTTTISSPGSTKGAVAPVASTTLGTATLTTPLTTTISSRGSTKSTVAPVASTTSAPATLTAPLTSQKIFYTQNCTITTPAKNQVVQNGTIRFFRGTNNETTNAESGSFIFALTILALVFFTIIPLGIVFVKFLRKKKRRRQRQRHQPSPLPVVPINNYWGHFRMEPLPLAVVEQPSPSHSHYNLPPPPSIPNDSPSGSRLSWDPTYDMGDNFEDSYEHPYDTPRV